MVIIKKYADLLATKESPVNSSLLAWVELEFREAHASWGGEQPLTEFQLDSIVILEPLESDLRPIGIPADLITIDPEFVEKNTLADHTEIYRVGISYSGNTLYSVYFALHEVQPATLEWIDACVASRKSGGAAHAELSEIF